jgi:hypothetical protein
MMKHAHPEFPSDLFIVLETVGAKITISKTFPLCFLFIFGTKIRYLKNEFSQLQKRNSAVNFATIP